MCLGARAALCPTIQAFTPKSALCCPGLKIFSLDIARLSKLHEGEERVARSKFKVTETSSGGGVREKSSGRVTERRSQLCRM